VAAADLVVAADYMDLTLLALVVMVVVVVEYSAGLSTLLLTVKRSFASRLPAVLYRVLLLPHLCSNLRIIHAGPLRPIHCIWWSPWSKLL
jgi:hypothetical protein